MLAFVLGVISNIVWVPWWHVSRALAWRIVPIGSLFDALLTLMLWGGAIFAWIHILNLLFAEILPFWDRRQHNNFLAAGLLTGLLGGQILAAKAIARHKARRVWPFVD